VKVLLAVGVTMVLLAIESVIVKYAGWSVTRIDVTVAVIGFLALRAGTLEGAFSSFFIGYLVDLISARPTGLYTFLAVVGFLFGRLAASIVEVRTALGFALFVMAGDAIHGFLAILMSWLVSRSGGVSGGVFSGMPLQVLVTGIAALCLYPALRKMEPAAARAELQLR
jgi:rod shape-determining protein MreD